MRWRIMAAISAAVIIVGGTVGAILYSTQNRVEAPTLAVKTEFPKGFHQQLVPMREVSFDGQSKCTGAKDVFTGDEWGNKGVMHVDVPTTKQILAAHPVAQADYKVTMHTQRWHADHHPLEEINPKSNCSFRYAIDLWQVDSTISNTKPIQIRDPDGNAFQYALTPVTLGGGGGDGRGTRFLLEGRATDPGNLTLDHRLFESGHYEPTDQLHGGVAGPLMVNGTVFQIVFDVPLETGNKDLMLIATRRGNDGAARAVQDPLLSFDRLFRLETQSARLILVPQADAENAALVADPSQLPGALVASAPSLQEAVRRAADLTDDLQALSSAAILLQTAVEPRAPVASSAIVQVHMRVEARTWVSLDIENRESAGFTRVEHAWLSSRERATLTIRITERETKQTVAGLAGATAAVSQIGADGLEATRAFASGATMDDAVIAASSLVRVRGGAQELSEARALTSARSSAYLRISDRYFLAAAGIHAGWQWLAAQTSNDPVDRLERQLDAAYTATSAIFALTPEGLAVVAALDLGHYVLKKTGILDADGALMKAAEEVQTTVFGDVSPAVAQKANAVAATQIRDYAVQHDAVVPDRIEVNKANPTGWYVVPTLIIIGLLALAVVGISLRR